jgi:hypothetical protein
MSPFDTPCSVTYYTISAQAIQNSVYHGFPLSHQPQCRTVPSSGPESFLPRAVELAAQLSSYHMIPYELHC